MALITEMLKQMVSSTQSKDMRTWLMEELLQAPGRGENPMNRGRKAVRSSGRSARNRGKVSMEMLSVLTEEFAPAELLDEEGSGMMAALHKALINEHLIEESSNYISWLGRLAAKYARNGRVLTVLHILRTRAIYIGTLATLHGYDLKSALAHSFVAGLSDQFPPDAALATKLNEKLIGDLNREELMTALQLDEQEMAELTSQFLAEILV